MDIQALFEQNSVPEILEELNRTRRNIDKEREELRIMVSERYRDLIEAADSIVDMQSCAEKICQHVQLIETGCSHLHHEGLVGFRARDEADMARKDKKRRVYDVGARVKLLMDMPERLWLLVERRDVLTAALLHLLAQYIYTGLQVERLEPDGQRVMKQFPVVGRQWGAVLRFRNTILTTCDTVMREATLDQRELVTSCLVSVCLLEGSDCSAACRHLLVQRRQAVLTALRPDCAAASAQTQITQAVRLIVHTLQLVHACFLGDSVLNQLPEGLFLARLSEALSCTRPFDLVDDRGSVAMRHLSNDIKNYRPVVGSGGGSATSAVTQADIRQMMEQWLGHLQHGMEPKVSQLLDGVPSVKGLASIRDSVYSTLLDEPHSQHWPAICEQLVGTNVSVWEMFLREAVVRRAERHVQDSVSGAFSQLTDSVAAALADPDRLKSDVNVVDFRWSDVTELPSTGGWMNCRHRNQQSLPGLTLRSRGHTPLVQQVCSALDGRLAALLADLSHFTDQQQQQQQAETTGRSLLEAAGAPFDRWSDGERLRAGLGSAAEEHTAGLVGRLEQLAAGRDGAAPLLLARLPRALLDLCPHLPLCLRAADRRQLWDQLSAQLLAVRPRLLTAWTRATADRLAQQLTQALSTISDTEISDLTHWSAVSVSEEESESGQVLESVLRVPRAPRLSLLSTLYQLSTDLNRMGSMTLGREVQSQLIQTCVRRLVSCYSVYLQSRPSADTLSQHQALQTLTDVHFLHSLTTPRDQELVKEIGRLCDVIDEYIDPFDLSVSWPHAQRNLRLFTLQSQSVLGALSVDRGALKFCSPPPGGQQDQPSLLPVSSRPVRFSLLAVPDSAPLGRAARPAATRTREDKTEASRQQQQSVKSSSSSSFLAGLGASWF